MELEGIMLSEINQSEKDNYGFIHMWNIRNSAEDHGGREGKLSGKSSKRKKNHERLLTVENKQHCWRKGFGEMG